MAIKSYGQETHDSELVELLEVIYQMESVVALNNNEVEKFSGVFLYLQNKPNQRLTVDSLDVTSMLKSVNYFSGVLRSFK